MLQSALGLAVVRKLRDIPAQAGLDREARLRNPRGRGTAGQPPRGPVQGRIGREGDVDSYAKGGRDPDDR